MRRQVGLAAAQNRQLVAERFREVGETLASEHMKRFRELFSSFRTNLETFAGKHRDKLKKSPELRLQFQKMCAQLGVDPLVSSKGVWTEMLGFGDFYYDLTVQIAEICMAHSARTGGLMRLSELLQRLRAARSSAAGDVGADDVLIAVKRLGRLGGGYTAVPLADKDWLIQSVPMELSLDHSEVLRIAEEKAYITKEEMRAVLGWDQTRTDRIVTSLLRDGLVWIDNQHRSPGSNGETTAYWFPSLFKTVSLIAS